MEELNEEKETIKDETKIRILIVGNSRVGKTCLISRYVNDIFKEKYISTIGLDFETKYLNKNNKKYEIELIETKLENNLKIKYEGIIFVYDTTDQQSFDDISNYIEFIQEKKGKKFNMILLGNKIDEEEGKKVFKETGEKLAEEKEVKFYEVSCKDGTNVNEAINALIDLILETRSERKAEIVNENIGNDQKLIENKNEQKKDKTGCCPCCPCC